MTARINMGSALELAETFHEFYETLAPHYGYETRGDTKTFDPNSPNGRLMVAVCEKILMEYMVDFDNDYPESMFPPLTDKDLDRIRAEIGDNWMSRLHAGWARHLAKVCRGEI